MSQYQGKSGEWSQALHPVEILRAVPAAVLVVHRDTLAIVDLTAEAAEALAYDRAALVGRAIDDVLVIPPRAAIASAARRAFDDRGTTRLDAICRRGDGTPLTVAVSIAALSENPNVPLVLVSVPTDAWQRMDQAIRDVNRALHETNQFLDAIVENIPDMVVVKDAVTLRFERLNRTGEQLLGWPRDELIGRTDHDLYPGEQANFFQTKDRETLRDGKIVEIAEEPIQTRHGPRWLHTKKVPIRDPQGQARYLLSISEDVTERKLAEERAHALERELVSVVHHAREAIISWTLDGIIVTWNTAAELLYRVPAQRAIGASLHALIPDAAAELKHAQARLIAGDALPITHTTRVRDGVEIEVEESLFALRNARAEITRIASIARDVSEIGRLRRANEYLARPTHAPTREEARSDAMRETLLSAEVVALDSYATVLLLGDTGVGKSWLARRIHEKSPRAHKPFLEVNCASLGSQLAESELFGHERGAFTGATSQKRGLVEAADGGTVFLDEVGELPPSAQAQLLTFLDAKRFRRVGGTRPLTADVRILAATNADLHAAAAKGGFRKDLFYRLSVVPISIPPLRERREEIAPLAMKLVTELASRTGARPPVLDDEIIHALVRYDWPGNVRELRNALERAMILGRGQPIQLQHLPIELRSPPSAGAPDTLDAREREYILRTLEACGGNRTHAAERLGISRSTLKRKLAQLRER